MEDTTIVRIRPGSAPETLDRIDRLDAQTVDRGNLAGFWAAPSSIPGIRPKTRPDQAATDFHRNFHLPNEPVGTDPDFNVADLGLDFEVPSRAEPATPDSARLPEVGTSFLGFRLVEELGRGAFGRVYLAHQGELADRPVALKVSAERPGESRTLARLQHTNIVPIFSAHHAPPLHAVCMPFHGSTTLGDVFDELERSGSIPESGRTLLDAISSRRDRLGPVARASSGGSGPRSAPSDPMPPPSEAEASGPAEGSPPATSDLPETLRLLGGMPYVEAVLTLMLRLADGLIHAHDRGILHRDLKPANVLLTDDGQPMLLDFNLSDDVKEADGDSEASIGGTLPYMAPEHIDAFRGGPRPVDARSDLYSLGVIAFELLTGQHPFPVYDGKATVVIAKMIDDRRAGPPGVRAINPRVSPAVESIVRHLLEPEPDRRYRSARELHEDIGRQLADLPLRHAPETSIRERARKFSRRHPRLTSSTSIATVALACLMGMGMLLVQRSRRLAHLEAAETLAAFQADLDTARFLLHTKTDDRDRRSKGVAVGRRALGLYGVEGRPDWRGGPAVVDLGPISRDALVEDVGELGLILARARALDVADARSPADRSEKARDASKLLVLAGACFAADRAPKSLRVQEAELAALEGRGEEARRLRAIAEATPPRSARDRYLIATGLAVAGEFRKALPLAREAAREEPQNFWAWFVAAFCHDRLEQDAEAAACYGTCVALRPEFAEAWFNRGLIQLRRDDKPQAIADFDRAITLRPEWYEPVLNRGIAELSGGDNAGAIRDLTRAVELGAPETRVFFLRAVARQRSGDAEGARRDRSEGLRREPTDEPSWVSRGMARVEAEPEQALLDFGKALELNPRSLPALQDRAHVLARLDRTAEAVGLLDRAVALYPDYVPARSGRGVLLSILGRRDEAIRDAKEATWRDTSPMILYQAAGIYAMTSKQAPDDRIEAFRLLSTALRGGFGFNELEADRELDPIRDQPEFRELLAAAKALLPRPEPPAINAR